MNNEIIRLLVLPTVTLTAPAKGSTVTRGGTIQISADSADSDGSVIRVEFYAGDTLRVHDVNVLPSPKKLPSTDTSAPYSFYWKPGFRGSFTLTARAYDDDSAVTISDPVSVRVK